MTNDLPGLLILASLLFLIIRHLVRWMVKSSVLSEFILRFVYPQRMATAYIKAEKGMAARNAPDEEEYTAKLAQLSAFRYKKRLLAISYFENVPATTRLVNRLIDVLPHQRQQETKRAMIRLLCKTVNALDLDNHGQLIPTTRFLDNIQIGIRPWSFAISAWLTELILVIIVLILQIEFGVTEFMIAGAIIFIVSFVSALLVVRNRVGVIKVCLVSLAVALASLWSYSETSHAGFASTERSMLDSRVFGSIGVEVLYPRWLTAADMNACNKSATIFVFGEKANPLTKVDLQFLYDRQVLYAVDKDCSNTASVFPITATNPYGDSAELFLRPLNLDVLTGSPVTITVQARNPSASKRFVPVPGLEFPIALEEPIWKSIRDICSLGTGAVTAPAFIFFIFDWYLRRKEKT